jgi:S-DNA-T family DNA segregation ATPase FtsK/SpoIIIE
VFDEVQVYTEYDDKDIRAEFVAIMADIVRRGRSAGIIPIFCTQKPAASVIPSIIVDNCSTRLCFRVNGQRANDAVLGNEMHSRGIKATKFGPDDKGLAWLKGDGAEPMVVRTVHGIDKPTSERLMAKARAMRERLGMLTGYAAGEEAEAEQEQVELLTDCRTAMDLGSHAAMHLEDLRVALAELRPSTWTNLDNGALGAMLREAGVPVGQVKVKGRNTSGVRRESLDRAATSDEDPDEPEVGDVAEITPRTPENGGRMPLRAVQ